VLPDEADEPAEEAPAEVPAKLPAMADEIEHASSAHMRSGRIIGWYPRLGGMPRQD